MTIDVSLPWQVIEGDCLAVMPTLSASSVDAVVTDPPYGLAFMGKEWDHGIPGVPFWIEALRLAKPGAHLLAFGGTRTIHRLGCAIEDAGWEVRDMLCWLQGQGFPKSHNLPGGLGTALKPAWEGIIVARKPLVGTVAQNVQKHGTGALNVDGCRIAGPKASGSGLPPLQFGGENHRPFHDNPTPREFDTTQGRWPANVVLDLWYDPVLRLREDAPEAVWEFFRDYGPVQGLRVPDPDVPEPREADAVLRESVLREVAHNANGRAASDVRQGALPGITGEDAPSEEGGCAARTGRADVGRGAAPRARVRHGERGPADTAGARAIRTNGEQVEQPVCAGASPSHGAEAGAPLTAERGRASQERREVGQPAPEPGTLGQRDAQAGPRRDPSGTAARAAGERGAARGLVEVAESDAPRAWLRYFDRTGDALRKGAARLLDEQSGESGSPNNGSVVEHQPQHERTHGVYGPRQQFGYEDFVGASRFFYTAKASRSEREAGLRGPKQFAATMGSGIGAREHDPSEPRAFVRNTHPTVKPVDLMRWLVRLVTPPGGLVLDPFTGSGTTGIAAHLEGCRFLGIEREAAYVEIANARIAAVAAQGILPLQ